MASIERPKGVLSQEEQPKPAVLAVNTEQSLDRLRDFPTISDLFPTHCNAIFDFLGVSRDLNDDIRVTDIIEPKDGIRVDDSSGYRPKDGHSGDLQITHLIQLHYCSFKSEVSHIRGLVLDVSDVEQGNVSVVCRSLGFTPEYTLDDTVPADLLNETGGTVIVAHEGTILRVFHHKGDWYISTHKKIDARTSRWGKRTFFSIFNEVWNLAENPFEGYLNKECCYNFLISSPDNRIVLPCETSMVRYICHFTGGRQLNTLEYSKGWLKKHPFILGKDLFVTTARTLGETIEDFRKKEEELSLGTTGGRTFPGCGILFIRENGKAVKILSRWYCDLFDLRNGETSLQLRYLQLLREGNEERLKRFMDLFPEQKWMNLDGVPKKLVRVLRIRRRRTTNEVNSIERVPAAVHFILTEATKFRHETDAELENRFSELLKEKKPSDLNFILKFLRNKRIQAILDTDTGGKSPSLAP